jgi:hypothetical protein
MYISERFGLRRESSIGLAVSLAPIPSLARLTSLEEFRRDLRD